MRRAPTSPVRRRRPGTNRAKRSDHRHFGGPRNRLQRPQPTNARGSIVGGLVVGRLIARWGPITIGVTGATLFALSCLARCLPWWPGTVAASVVAGVGLPWTLVAAVTAVQTSTPSALLGRVSGTVNTAMFGPLALAIPLGSAAVHLGDRLTLIAAAAICLTAARCAAGRPRRRRRGTGALAMKPSIGTPTPPLAPRPPAG